MDDDKVGIVELQQMKGEHLGTRDSYGKAVKVAKAVELTAVRQHNPRNRGLLKYFFLNGRKHVQVCDIDAETNAISSIQFAFDGSLTSDNKFVIQAAAWFGLPSHQMKSIILVHAPKKK